MRGAGRGEISFVGVVRPLAIVDVLDQLRYQEIEVRIALSMSVARKIHRHSVHVHGEVGAMVEIEAAQEVLIRLSGAAVLRDDHAGNDLQNFRRPQQRPVLELLFVDRSLARRVGFARQAFLVRVHYDRLAPGQSCRERLHYGPGSQRDQNSRTMCLEIAFNFLPDK